MLTVKRLDQNIDLNILLKPKIAPQRLRLLGGSSTNNNANDDMETTFKRNDKKKDIQE